MKTDVQLRNDVLAELKWEPSVNETGIGVIVNDGVVTLTGHPSSYAEKLAAERATQRVAGVKALAVEMTVHLADGLRRNDAEIADAAERALKWSTVIPVDRIRVKVEKGWVTLSGEVPWEYQRGAAIRAVHDLRGVVGVSNAIVIKPMIQPQDVERRIKEALERQADYEAKHVHVAVDGSRVTLNGRVHTYADRRIVDNAAWAAPGVSSVTNNLSVS